jgi:hypothetical protein
LTNSARRVTITQDGATVVPASNYSVPQSAVDFNCGLFLSCRYHRAACRPPEAGALRAALSPCSLSFARSARGLKKVVARHGSALQAACATGTGTARRALPPRAAHAPRLGWFARPSPRKGRCPRIARRLRRPCATLPRSLGRRCPPMRRVGCRRRPPLRSFRRGAVAPSLRSVAPGCASRAPRRGYGSTSQLRLHARASPTGGYTALALRSAARCPAFRPSGRFCRSACFNLSGEPRAVSTTPPPRLQAGSAGTRLRGLGLVPMLPLFQHICHGI